MSNEKIPLSVIILAHVTDEKLRRAIESVEWAAEIIIGWAGAGEPKNLNLPSQGKLIRISKEITDFAATRNEVMKHANNDWVFFLDSDEILEKGGAEKISKLIMQKNLAGISIQRKDVFLGRVLQWGEVHNMRLLRIFRKQAGQFTRAVHEYAEVQGEVARSDITIFHYAHDSISTFLQKIIFYAGVDANVRDGQHVSALSLFAWPKGKFLVNYFLKLGILDGWRGLVYATVMSMHSFSVRALQYEKQK